MSEAMETQQAAKALSPQARKLLAELSSDMPVAAADVPQQGEAAPLLLAPHADAKAHAFAELLDHIEDSDGTMLVDEQAALAVAEKYRSEKQAANIAFDNDDLLEEFSADADAPQTSEDETPTLTDPEIDAALGKDPFGEDPFGDEEGEESKAPGRFGRLMMRFRQGAGGVTRLIGVRDAAAAYDAQSGASLLPFTIIRAVVLVLVAAVPPAINLAVIQPQISDNSRKLTQIRSFEAKMAEDKKAADKMAVKLSSLEQDAKRRIDRLMPNADLETLFNKYVAALQKYDIDLQGYNVSSMPDRKVIIGNRVQEASLVELDLVGRYDIYAEIRKIFVDQLKVSTVVKETMAPREGSPELAIKASLMVPTKREYDGELDDPAKAEAEAK